MSPRSSQAFALNLFAPLDPVGLVAVFGLLGIDVFAVDPAVFEYSDELDRLNEAKPGSPHRTQVDVYLRARTRDGRRMIALIEVKFTETDFGGCSAYQNPANPDRGVCRSAGMFGGQPDRCFQLSNHGAGRRGYDQYLADIPITQPSAMTDDGGCVVRLGRNQPMRNLALAQLLLAEGEADVVTYALCAPEAHPTIWRRLAEVRSTFPDTPSRTIRALTAQQVAALHGDRGRAIAAYYDSPELAWNTSGPFPTD